MENRGGFQSRMWSPNSLGLFLSGCRLTIFGGSCARALAVIGIVLAFDGCASPDRSDYARAAAQHADWAQEAREGAGEDEAAARSAAAQGNDARANDLRNEGMEFTKRSRLEQFRADKDQWLSQWWPDWSHQ